MNNKTEDASNVISPQLYLYNEHKAAQLLGVSKRWLQSARQNGNGPPFVKIGRLIRYRQQDIDSWISAQIRTSTSSTSN